MSKEPAESCDEVSFEQSLAELEQIVRRLEEGQLGLSDALAQYEAGVRHLKQCYSALEKAERRIELLAGVDASGNPITRPFEDEAMSLEEKAGTRSRRRSSRPARQPEPPAADEDAEEDVDERPSLF